MHEKKLHPNTWAMFNLFVNTGVLVLTAAIVFA